MGAVRESDSARIRFVACFWPEKMSKDVEKVPLAVVLAHFENIFISKSVVGMNFFQLMFYFKKYRFFFGSKIAKYNQFFHPGTKSNLLSKSLCRKRFSDENIFKMS